jgi:hypothetical protein
LDQLYVLQRDRCDWPDIVNVVYCTAPELDWTRLMSRLGDDVPLLSAAITVFAWMFPCRSQDIPSWVREALRVPPPVRSTESESEERIRRIDSRPWFRPSLAGARC